uniref:Uncharacterized protein n=1 Tax=Caenorhabditis japonica TaxID=281687 RepID=A0A8R1I911_CAEJA
MELGHFGNPEQSSPSYNNRVFKTTNTVRFTLPTPPPSEPSTDTASTITVLSSSVQLSEPFSMSLTMLISITLIPTSINVLLFPLLAHHSTHIMLKINNCVITVMMILSIYTLLRSRPLALYGIRCFLVSFGIFGKTTFYGHP